MAQSSTCGLFEVAKGEEAFWMGYEVRLTETRCASSEAVKESGPAPSLITDVHSTEVTVMDVKATVSVQQRLADHGSRPSSTTSMLS
ncbi:hypothetical protein [Streptomyces sp. SID724]|uniref:hypothetical protein n=1 Tax=Streptomyces sp. SID724 TaxID=2690324 RepID=UPI001925DB85